MELRTCVFCGTEYDRSRGVCPVCGKPEEGSANQSESRKRKITSSSGARVASRGRRATKRTSGPQWPWALLCIVLGFAVVAGIVVFFSTMSFFEEGFDFNAIPTLLEQNPEYNYDAQDSLEQMQQTVQQPEPEVQQPSAPAVVTAPDSKSCTALTINQNTVTLDEAGAKVFLTAVARPSDCEDPILFSSQDETVVTVTDGGMLMAIGPGMADVIVSCGSVTQVCTVICDFVTAQPEQDPENDPDEEAVYRLDKVDFTLFEVGEEATLTVENAPDDAVISFKSSDSNIASVDDKGVVKAVKKGQATITATVDGTELTCIVRCNLEETPQASSYTGPLVIKNEYGSTGDATFVRAGEKCTLSLKDANGKSVTGLTWTTSNGSVCSVDSEGKVTAVGSGMATVSTVFGGETYKFTIRCNF